MGKNKSKAGIKSISKFIFLFIIFFVIIFASPGQYDEGTRPGRFSIEQCIEIALKNSPSIKIAQGTVRKSKLDVGDARANFLPDVSLSGGYYINKTYNTFEWNENHYDLSISASMQPFTSGRTYLDVERTDANLRSAREGYRLTEMDLVMEVISRYYNLLKSSQILELGNRTLKQKQNQLDFSKAQFELGMVPRADTLKARAALEGARVDLHEANGELLIRKAELNEIMGLDLDSTVSIQDVELKEPNIPEFDSVLSLAYSYRPDIKRQGSSISAAKYNMMIAWLNRMPTLTLTGGYNVYAEKFAFEGLPLNRSNLDDNSDWSVGLVLSFPMFDGGTKARNIRRANIDLNNARLGYEELKRQAELEVKSAHLSLENASKKIELTQRQVASARESYEAAMGRYKNGLAPITEVIDAEVTLTEGEVNFINSKYDFLEAEALLEKVTGVLYNKEELK
jgi:outer membrane protein TolC